MPSARCDVIAPVIKYVMQLDPDSILDVGAGFGKWGLLLREYLEVWQGRLYPHEWQKRIDALEIFPDYTTLPWYEDIYDQVLVGDVLDYIDVLPQYDLVLLLDVIEHLEKDRGLHLLRKTRSWVVTTPAYVNKQKAMFGNPHEAHISFWKTDDFENARLIGEKFIFAWK